MRWVIGVRIGGVAGLAMVLACAVGNDEDGFSSAASLGGDDAPGTSHGSVGGNEGSGGSDDTAGAASVGGNEGGDGPMPPTNPDEACNGVDDDNNGLIDDGLGEIGCGVGECANIVPACVAGGMNVCQPMAPGVEACNGLDDDCNGAIDDAVAPVECSSACGSGTQACDNGVLGTCNAPQPSAEACNTEDDDCDGDFDEGVAGCRVGVHRSYNASTGEHFYTTSLMEAQSPGFTLEFENFYYLYANAQPGTVPFNRCWVPALGMHLYTTSANCEGTTFEGVMGHIGTSAFAGATTLYRAYNPSTGDHFYTTSQAEFNNAVAGAYVAEGDAGFVW